MPEQQGVMSAYQLMPHTHQGIGQGGIINNDNLFQSCGCYVFRNVNQIIPDIAITKILFDATAYDIGADFNADGINSEFIVPETGFYYVSALVTLEALADNTRVITYIYVDGVIVSHARANSSNSVYSGMVSPLMRLTAGQIVDIRIYHNHGANRNALGVSDSTFVSIFKIGE